MSETRVRKANALHPQIVTLVIDDSGSMREGNKAQTVNKSLQSLLMTLETNNFGSIGSRYFVNAAKFGDGLTVVAECARPFEVDEKKLLIDGGSGRTNIPVALEWAAKASQQALVACRKIHGYVEADCPSPMVVFLTDGENTHGDPRPAAEELKRVSFAGGPIDVLAIAVGVSASGFETMKQIASKPEFAFNIDPSQIHKILAAIEETFVKDSTSLDDVAANRY